MLCSLRKLYAKLHLRVNEAKTKVGSAFGRKFLGYCFRRWTGDRVKIAVASEAIATFKQRIRFITRRVGGPSMVQVAEELWLYLPGWKLTSPWRRLRAHSETLIHGYAVVSGRSSSSTGDEDLRSTVAFGVSELLTSWPL